MFFYLQAKTFTHCWAATFISVTLWGESERLIHGVNVQLASSHPEAQELKYCGWYNITLLHTKPDADCMWKMQSWLLWNSVEMGKVPEEGDLLGRHYTCTLAWKDSYSVSVVWMITKCETLKSKDSMFSSVLLKFDQISYNLDTNASAKDKSTVHLLIVPLWL